MGVGSEGGEVFADAAVNLASASAEVENHHLLSARQEGKKLIV